MTGITYPERLPLAQLPTPLERLDRLSDQLGVNLWVKRDDLTGSWLTGNKVRKLEFVVAEARAQGADTLITVGAIQSNHCRATALVGARLGMKVHLVLRGTVPEVPSGNLLLGGLAGAMVIPLTEEEFATKLDSMLEELVAEVVARGGTPYVIPMGASNALGAWGYIRMVEEMATQATRQGLRVDHVVCATGSGGTQTGLVLGNCLHGLNAQIWGFNVCNDEAYFVEKIRADMRAWVARWGHPEVLKESVRVVDGFVGPGYGVADERHWATILRLAAGEGLLLDPVYTSKAFTGLLEEIGKGRFLPGETVVFVHTGGVFGLLGENAMRAPA